MPPREPRLLLADIIEACDLILRAAPANDRDGYLADPIRRAAVERQFEIIGEAVRQLLAIEPAANLRLPEARKVVQFRNFIAHGYHFVDHAKVWPIIRADVPTLRDRSQGLLRDLGAEGRRP